MPPPPTYLPLRWESTGDQWWYASPIDWAAANGHYDLVRELLRLDGNHLIKLTSLRRIRRLETVWDDDEQFHDVARYRSEVARQLLSECEVKKGKNSLIGAGYGGWLLYTAASAGDLGFVQELLQRDPLLVFGEGEYGVTDILYAAARSKSDEVFRVVHDFCAWPRFPGDTGARPATEEHVGENDEIPSAYKSEIMNRALHAAARGGNLKLVKEILGDCSDKEALGFRDVKGATLLHAAAARGQVEVVKDLISSFWSITNSTDNQGNTALHAAAHRGHIAVVEALILASPSSINARNNAGETFLHSVVTGFQTPGFRRLDRHIELMHHLLCGKVFKIEEIMNAKNNDGRTALHLAITGNIHSDLVELLMSVTSIDVNIRDSDGMTPLDIIRQQPQSTSSELLTRQLISAGGIFSSNDYSARKVIASHIKRQSMGNSPGTSFNLSDTEIFLYTGMDNASDDAGPSVHNVNSPDQHDSNHKETNCRKIERSGSVNSAAQRLKCFLRWPRMKRKSSEQRIKKLVEGSCDGVIPIPLRQKFSKPSPLPNNKRALSVPSPPGNKKLASGVMHGAMQAVPNFKIRNRSRSSSFSKLSSSSQSSAETPKGSLIHEYDHAKPCSSSYEASGVGDGKKWTVHGQSGMGKKKRLMMNQYLCFGAAGSGKHVEPPPPSDDLNPPYDVYERSVLSAS